MIAWTIRAALAAELLTDHVVSTNDESIRQVALDHGAHAPFLRPANLATDEVRNIDVCLHALAYMENEAGRQYDMVILLQPTCPIRNPKHITDAIELLDASPLQTLASVSGPYRKRDPILKSIRQGVLENYEDDDSAHERKPFWMYNASIYATKRDYLISERSLISPYQVPLEMDALHSIDVDVLDDAIIAEAALRFLEKES